MGGLVDLLVIEHLAQERQFVFERTGRNPPSFGRLTPLAVAQGFLALALGHRIGLMSDGKLRGVYTPEEFLRSKDNVVSKYVDVLRENQEAGHRAQGTGHRAEDEETTSGSDA